MLLRSISLSLRTAGVFLIFLPPLFSPAFTSVVLERDALALYGRVVAGGWRFPNLARALVQSGVGVIRQGIAELLEAGGVPANRSRQAAGEVVALSLGDAYQRAALGIAT